MSLSIRLKCVADMVTNGVRLADIGTDHAYIPIELVASGRIPSAIAMDINPGPLQKASENIAAYGLSDRIECRHSDGFASMIDNEADCAVIAGMGGDLICRIISDRPEAVHELVLSPHTHYEKVRHTLRHLQYEIKSERMVNDSGKFYLVIKAEKNHNAHMTDYDVVSDYFGSFLLKSKDPVLKEYLLDQKRKFESIPQKEEYMAIVNRALNEWELI